VASDGENRKPRARRHNDARFEDPFASALDPIPDPTEVADPDANLPSQTARLLKPGISATTRVCNLECFPGAG
jgi:hypothetical protein